MTTPTISAEAMDSLRLVADADMEGINSAKLNAALDGLTVVHDPSAGAKEWLDEHVPKLDAARGGGGGDA